MIFTTTHSTVKGDSLHAWADQLKDIPVPGAEASQEERALMTMWAVDDPFDIDDATGKPRRNRIGHLELMTPLIYSKFGDERLYFQHVKAGGDFAYMKENILGVNLKREDDIVT